VLTSLGAIFCVLQGTQFAEVTTPGTRIPDFPQTAIITTRQLAKKNIEKRAAMLWATKDAASLCDQPEHHHDVAKILSHQLDVGPDIIKASFACFLPFGAERDKSL
jgi:ABC-type nitrate/sulfonate/bicarbonate transport system substrate-binding protein